MTIMHDGFTVQNFKIPCLDDPQPYNDHKNIDNFMNKGSYSVVKGAEYQDILKEFAFLMKHCVKRTNSMEFIKNIDEPKCNHCTERPIEAKQFMEFIKGVGGKKFTPTPDPLHEGHYYTFLHCRFLYTDLHREPLGS